jgi:hypothetical protein
VAGDRSRPKRSTRRREGHGHGLGPPPHLAWATAWGSCGRCGRAKARNAIGKQGLAHICRGAGALIAASRLPARAARSPPPHCFSREVCEARVHACGEGTKASCGWGRIVPSPPSCWQNGAEARSGRRAGNLRCGSAERARGHAAGDRAAAARVGSALLRGTQSAHGFSWACAVSLLSDLGAGCPGSFPPKGSRRAIFLASRTAERQSKMSYFFCLEKLPFPTVIARTLSSSGARAQNLSEALSNY